MAKHNSDCAIYNTPIYNAGPCNCNFEFRIRGELAALQAERDKWEELATGYHRHNQISGEEIAKLQAQLADRDARLAVVGETLAFYANPFNRKDDDGDRIRVPDFYDEMVFGELAEQTIATLPERAKAMLAVRKAAKETDEAEAALWPDGPPLGAEDLHNAVVTIREALKQLEAHHG